jgi:membrane peptidoglycan carboxypeptidase
MPAVIADAANYILQGDLTGLGTAPSDGIGRPAASKTGTADKYMSAFFVGYTPDLLGAVWTGNPKSPTKFPMSGYPGSCFNSTSGFLCEGFMYGSMAPGQTWQRSFLHARLANPPPSFVPVPQSSPLFALGNGQVSSTPPSPGGGHHGGGGGGGGGGHHHHHHHGGGADPPPTR